MKEALLQSNSLDSETKQKLKPLIKADYMSSDESVVSSDDKENTDLEIKHKRHKFLRHIVVWRSAEFQDFITSLDRKVCRKRTEEQKYSNSHRTIRKSTR